MSTPTLPTTLAGVDLSALHPDDLDAVHGYRAWRIGPWRDRRERWDLMPVGDLAFSEAMVAGLVATGIHTAGQLQAALDGHRTPTVLASGDARMAATAMVRAVRTIAEREREAIAADLRELVGAMVERRAAGPAITPGESGVGE